MTCYDKLCAALIFQVAHEFKFAQVTVAPQLLCCPVAMIFIQFAMIARSRARLELDQAS